ncbi:hypothetical protein GCM10023187_23190 [Nibrella viscosa]|uniref:histidine kinase n=1 Tax=Nibrella viscosa TaxID=1084524 RepID=A0ABP8KE50_9BACT
MNPADLILLHTHSIMAFIMVLITGGMVLYVIRIADPTPIRNWMAVFYALQTFWQFGDMIRYSLHPSLTGSLFYQLQVSAWFAPALSGVLITFTQVCYLFLEDTFLRERRMVFWFMVLLSAGFVGFNIWNEFRHGSDEVTMQVAAFLYGLFTNIWTMLICLRKAGKLKVRNPRAARGHTYLATIIGLGFILPCLIAIISGFYTPAGYYSYFILLWLGNIAEVLVYITFAVLPANFQVKLVGFTFLSMTTLLLIVTLVFFPPLVPTDLPARLLQQDGLIKLFGIFLGATLLVWLLLPRILQASLTQPVKRLLAGVEQVNAGNLATHVPVNSSDEIGILTRNFNEMTESLKRASDRLTQYAETLEQKVAERTSELQQSLEYLRATQDQLVQREKMASLGELTAGVAHEIQNPLNFVNNLAEVSVELIGELREERGRELRDEELEETLLTGLERNLEKIVVHGKRADGIVKGMLQHSRIGSGQKAPTDLNALASEYLRLAYHGLRAKDKTFTAELLLDLDPDLGKVVVVSQDIGRVLLNLYNNALYATKEKLKRLNGSAAPEPVEAGYLPQILVSTRLETRTSAGQADGRPDNTVEIRVRDNGPGIPSDVLGKIYQPFFTTKPAGEGTGLGLSLSYDIVTKGHGGAIQVDTVPGEFSEFIIRLPVYTEENAAIMR